MRGEEKEELTKAVQLLEDFVLHYCVNRLYRDAKPEEVELRDSLGEPFTVFHTGPVYFLGRNNSIYQRLLTGSHRYPGKQKGRVISTYRQLLENPSLLGIQGNHYRGPVLYRQPPDGAAEPLSWEEAQLLERLVKEPS